jgi:cell division protease FtsH
MILKDMITVYGMSDVSGLMVLERRQHSFLGQGMTQKDYSEKMAEGIDDFIKKTLHEHYDYVKKTLSQYGGAIEEMTKVLLDVEVIEGSKVVEIIDTFEKQNGMESRLMHQKSRDSLK